MTDLYSLINGVRSALSDIPTDFLTDEQIYNELDKADVFCSMMVEPTTAETYLNKCITVLATFYAYVNYTTLAERQVGTLPPSSKVRVEALRSIALSFLQPVALERLDDNLVVDLDDQFRSRVATIYLNPTTLEYDE